MGSRLWLAMFVVIALAPDASASVYLGLTGGINNTSLSGDAPDKVKLGSSPGPMLGAVVEVDVAEDVRLTLQPMFVGENTKLRYEVSGQDEPVDSLKVELGYFRVPLLAKILAGNHRTYVTGGLDLGFLINATLTGSGDQDIEDLFTSMDLSAILGFGVNFPVGKPTINIELRYSLGVINIADTEIPDLELPARFRSSGFQLLTGVLIPLGGK